VPIENLKGKTVFINFWATWCPPCIAELPDLEDLYQNLKDDKEIIFLFINIDKDIAKASRFIQRKNLKIPIFRIASALPESLNFQSIPTTFVISKSGELIMKHDGMGQFNTDGFVTFLKRN
jgi:thiol-disulfide isomerase/thioredoxin